MNELSLFTGAGGGVLASAILGWRTVGYVEHNEYCQQVIAQRIRDGWFDEAPIFTDVVEFSQSDYPERYRGLVDVVTAGFPCQPFSIAGKQQSDDDDRNMWPATISVIRSVRPRIALLENVPSLLNLDYIRAIFRDLAEAGYDAKWCVLGAANLGAEHIRDRLWILGHANGHSQPDGPVNDEAQGVQGVATNPNSSQLEGRELPLRVGAKYANISYPRWGKDKPGVDRVLDGVANRSHRLKAIGNGQVPICAAMAYKILSGE